MNAPTPAHAHTLYAIIKTGDDLPGTEPEFCDDPGLEWVAAAQVTVVPNTNGGAALGERTVTYDQVLNLYSATATHCGSLHPRKAVRVRR